MTKRVRLKDAKVGEYVDEETNQEKNGYHI